MDNTITLGTLARFERAEFSLDSPCVICGGKFSLDGAEGSCGHTGTDTAEVIAKLKSLGKHGRAQLRRRMEGSL